MRIVFLLLALSLTGVGCKTLTPRDEADHPVDFLELGNDEYSEMDQALKHYRSGQWDKARKTFEKMRKQARRNTKQQHLTPRLDELLSNCCLGEAEEVLAKTTPPSARNKQKAIHLLDRAIAHNPRNTSAYNLWRELTAAQRNW